MGYLSVHPEIKEATPAMPTTVLQNVPLKSASQCERVARAFAICQISSLFICSWWAKVQGSPCTSFLVNRTGCFKFRICMQASRM